MFLTSYEYVKNVDQENTVKLPTITPFRLRGRQRGSTATQICLGPPSFILCLIHGL